jgi:hypothetical protein
MHGKQRRMSSSLSGTNTEAGVGVVSVFMADEFEVPTGS